MVLPGHPGGGGGYAPLKWKEPKGPMEKSLLCTPAARQYGSMAARQYGSAGCTGVTGVTCPTCRGTGRIPRGQEDMLVAVIPCNDVRLKPQRTKLYVCLSMGLCLVICCLVLYFLFPRAVVLVPVSVQSVIVYFTPKAVSLEVTNLINISNENFLPVHIVQLDVQGLISRTIMGRSKQFNVTRLDARSQLLYNMKLDMSIEDGGLRTFCQSKTIPIHTLFLELQITMQVSYLSHDEQLSMNIYEYIDCGNNSTVPHLPA